jgi:hypothetical protein
MGFQFSSEPHQLSFSMSGSVRRTQSKSKFSPAEDRRLSEVVNFLGSKDWDEVASHMPGRNPRQCRERWKNYVNPTIMRLPWTPSEEMLLEQKIAELGPKWELISRCFPNRSRNYVKNHWMTKQRRLRKLNRRNNLETVPPVPVSRQPPDEAESVETEMSRVDLFAFHENDDTFWQHVASEYF